MLDDCTDRALHPVVYACTSAGAVQRTPTCVDPGAADASCEFVETLLDACDVGGSCGTGGSGVLEHTSAEACVDQQQQLVVYDDRDVVHGPGARVSER